MTSTSAPEREPYLYIALSSVFPGRGPEYTQWYFDQHLPDMTAIPGVRDGQFYRALGDNRWGFCGFFQATRPNADIITDAFARASSGEMRLTDTTDPEKTLIIDATPQTPQSTVSSVDAGERCVLAFNGDVSDVDLKAWRAIDGVVNVHLLTLADALAVWKSEWRTLVLCDVRSEKGAAVCKALAQASASWRAPENYVGLFERVLGRDQ